MIRFGMREFKLDIPRGLKIYSEISLFDRNG